jgi:hypothetical protein
MRPGSSRAVHEVHGTIEANLSHAGTLQSVPRHVVEVPGVEHKLLGVDVRVWELLIFLRH